MAGSRKNKPIFQKDLADLRFVQDQLGHSSPQVTSIRELDFICVQCGRCCLLYGKELPGIEDDVKLWKKKKRKDILNWVDDFCGYDLWINQTTDEPAFICPWLKKIPKTNKYVCKIYEVRPEVCRAYPINKQHAKEAKCKGIWQNRTQRDG